MLGGVFALISVGLTLVFGVMNLINFAHGEFLMLGMYGGWAGWAYFGVDPLLAAPIIGLIVFLLGMVIERLITEPIISAPPIAQIMTTVGLGLVLRNVVGAVAENTSRGVETGYQRSFLIGDIRVNLPYLFAFGYAVLLGLLLSLFLSRTEFGRAMRATAQNSRGAILVGINPRRMYMLAFGIGVGLAAVGGAAIIPYTVTNPSAGQQYIVIMFTVVVLGGLGSVKGAMVAGLAVGVIQSISVLYISVQLQDVFVFVIFLLAIIIRSSRGGMRGVTANI